jgi:hypothetical protein
MSENARETMHQRAQQLRFYLGPTEFYTGMGLRSIPQAAEPTDPSPLYR